MQGPHPKIVPPLHIRVNNVQIIASKKNPKSHRSLGILSHRRIESQTFTRNRLSNIIGNCNIENNFLKKYLSPTVRTRIIASIVIIKILLSITQTKTRKLLQRCTNEKKFNEVNKLRRLKFSFFQNDQVSFPTYLEFFNPRRPPGSDT